MLLILSASSESAKSKINLKSVCKVGRSYDDVLDV